MSQNLYVLKEINVSSLSREERKAAHVEVEVLRALKVRCLAVRNTTAASHPAASEHHGIQRKLHA